MLTSRRMHLKRQRFHRRKNRVKAIWVSSHARSFQRTKDPILTSPVCLEDVFKLVAYGLSQEVCRILWFRGGYHTVGDVVSVLKTGGSISGVGPIRTHDLKAALAKAGVSL